MRGGWVPIAFGSVIFIVMVAWWGGYRALNSYMASHMSCWDTVVEEVKHGSVTLTPGIGVYLASPAEDVPSALSIQIRRLHAMPADIVIVTVLTENVPFATSRPSVCEVMPRVRRLTLYTGYMETADIPETLRSGVLGETESVATYYLSERRFVASDSGEMPAWLERIFAFLHRNSQTPGAYFGLPQDRVISIGTRVDL